MAQVTRPSAAERPYEPGQVMQVDKASLQRLRRDAEEAAATAPPDPEKIAQAERDAKFEGRRVAGAKNLAAREKEDEPLFQTSNG